MIDTNVVPIPAGRQQFVSQDQCFAAQIHLGRNSERTHFMANASMQHTCVGAVTARGTKGLEQPKHTATDRLYSMVGSTLIMCMCGPKLTGENLRCRSVGAPINPVTVDDGKVAKPLLLGNSL